MTPRAERLAVYQGAPCVGAWYRARLDDWACDHAHCSRALAIECACEHAIEMAKVAA